MGMMIIRVKNVDPREKDITLVRKAILEKKVVLVEEKSMLPRSILKGIVVALKEIVLRDVYAQRKMMIPRKMIIPKKMIIPTKMIIPRKMALRK